MEENQNLEVTSNLSGQTEQANEPVQENVTQNVTQNVTMDETQKSNESPLEGSASDVNIQSDVVNPTEDKNVVEGQPMTSDEIQKKLDKLKEYEVRDNELNELKKRLGVDETRDNVLVQADREFAMFENQAQQEYIKLCNKYGVDYRPDKIDESGRELQAKDPQAFYQLKYELDQLVSNVNQKREEYDRFVNNRNLAEAINRNRPVLDASPVMRQHIGELLRNGTIGVGDIDLVTSIGVDIAKEAYEMGRLAALQENSKPSPAKVLNDNVITRQTSSTATPSELTLEDIRKMDLATYAKNAKQIDKLILEGKIK